MSAIVRTVNPANEKVIAEYNELNAAELERAVAKSGEAFAKWRVTSFAERRKYVEDFVQALISDKQKLGEQMTREMGKVLRESLAEIDKSQASATTIVQSFPQWRSETEYVTAAGYGITRQPMGVLLGIMPWNFPLWQVLRFAIPALLCGNSILLKHAPNTWGSAETIGDIFARAFPKDLYQNLFIGVEAAGQLIADPRVRGVSLTGSRRAGMSVGGHAGAHLKKCVLELGGSDAYVVLDDANIQQAAELCAQSRLINAGQSCVSAKRFIVTQKNVEKFTAHLCGILATKLAGDPMVSETTFGPLARKDLRDQLHAQVVASVKGGAKLALGGEIPNRQGFYYPASVLTGVKPGHAAFDQELFGPVAAIIAATDDKDAIRLANQSVYGLGGAIFSTDVQRARALATTEMEAGMVFINDFVRSEPGAPFGGIKDSGLGRELGRDGCFEFTNIKSVFLKA